MLPDALTRLTPGQLLAVFGKKAGNGSGLDRVAEVQKVNDERGRKGLKPIIPSWL